MLPIAAIHSTFAHLAKNGLHPHFKVIPRYLSSVQLTDNLKLITNQHIKRNGLSVIGSQSRPLVVMLCWLLAKQKHINKYANYYTERDIDVLTVTITPWQLLWPIKGAQLVAGDVLQFLETNHTFNPLLLHGFSVGGYVWGEVLVRIAQQPKRYQRILERIEGQVFDSIADVSEIEIGFPTAVFPRNIVFQNALRRYMSYHMKAFEKVATKHYIRSSQLFHSTGVQAPALLLVSKADPVGSVTSNIRLKEDWERLGIKVFWKCWEQSPHVGHYRHHPEEYVAELDNYMMHIGMLDSRKKMHAKM